MKKILCLLSAVLLGFTSCSKDDDNESSDPVSSTLVKKRNYIDKDGVSSDNILYDGNKISSINYADGSILKYTYTGDFITKIEDIDKGGKESFITNYIYNNGKLDAFIEKNYKTKFTYNVDGTVSYEQFNITTDVEKKTGTAGKYTFKDGNLMKDETSTSSIAYEYDNKNSDLKNVLGLNLLINDEASYPNNIVKKNQVSGSLGNVHTYIVTSAYKYNDSNFPTERVVTSQNDGLTSTKTTQYTY